LEYLRFLRETIHARAKPFSIIIFTLRLFHTNIFTSEKILKEKKKASVS
tara:strand:- start:1059 stop:1205 length:147 start_codon:yes stop_codon:yes gene_type:complete